MIKVLPPKTAKEVVARERERKARTTLLMALSDDHLAKFHLMADAKEMWEAIKSRFGGNDESKKMQKYLLKQQFEGFSVSSSEGLHKGYDRFQTLLSQLEIHGAGVSNEDANQKFLRSLPSSWSQVALIMRTKPGSSSYTNEVIHSFFANQSSATQLDYDDLEQINDDDMEEMDLKWQVAMISMRIKKFHKRTGRKLQFDTKDPVGFDKTKVECFNCHKMGHFARDSRAKWNQDSRKRDARYNGNKARDNSRRLSYQEYSNALVTIDGEDIDWSGHVEEDAKNYAMMAYSNSGSDNKVQSCSQACADSYARLKKLYDEQRDKLGDASVEITSYTLALKKESDLEDTPVNDRYVDGMHAVPPPMTGNYMPSGPDVDIDYSKFTYGLKQPSADESDSKPSEYASCKSDSSVEPSPSVPELVENESQVVCEPKVWTDAPIIEEYESDSDDDSMSNVQKEKEKPSITFTNSVKHVNTSRENIKEKGTPNHSPKIEKAKQAELTINKNMVIGQQENRPVWNNVQRVNHQNKFVPSALLTKTSKFPVNDARQNYSSQAASTSTASKVNTARPFVNETRPKRNFYKSHSPSKRPFHKTTAQRTIFSYQQVNTIRNKSLSVVGGYGVTVVKALAGCNWRYKRNSLNKVSNYNSGSKFRKSVKDPLGRLKCSRNMTRNKAHLTDNQEFKGGSVAVGGKIKTGRLDFEDVYYVEELKHYNLFSVSQICDKKNKVLFTDTDYLVLSPDFELPHENQKGKQHKASCKAKTVSSVNQPLQILHMDLFKPTSAKAVNTDCYVLNRVLVTKPQNKTPYELLTSRQPIISYLRPFGCHVTILNTIDHLGKFDRKFDSGFLVRYYLNSKAFRVYNLETRRVEENLHVNFLENKPNVVGKGHVWMFDLDYLTNSMNYEPVSIENQANKSTGPKEANNSFAYSTTIKSSRDKIEKNEKPVSQVEQVFLKEHEKLKRKEKEANDAVESLRKEATHDTQNARTSNTNLLNTASTPLSIAGSSRAFTDDALSYPDPFKIAAQNDLTIPHLKDIYASPSEGIFTNSSYDADGVVTDFNNLETTMNVIPTTTTRIHTIHPKTQILKDPNSVVQTMSKVNKNNKPHALIYLLERKQLGLNRFTGTDERGVVVRNKARLVAQGHRQEEGIDYDEVFAPVARIEAIRIFLAFASYMGFIVYQMDVKSAFLYDTINEEVYVTQPPGFVDPKFPNKVYKVVKALYGLHQAPRAWFQMSSMGKLTFFLGLQVKQKEDGIFISQDKYVAKILKKFDFLSVKTASTPIETQNPLVKDEETADVDVHLYRSMIRSLMYLTTSRPDIMFAVCACFRFQVTPKTSHLYVVKRIFRYLKGKPKLGLWYLKVSSFNLEAYSDSDYAGANHDRKSTTGGYQFLDRRRISWQCKKQTIMATSTTKAEYVAAAHCCGQVLWIQNQLLDYGFNLMNTKIYIDNSSSICIVKNLVFHSKTKHIEIRHHFIRDAYEKKLIQTLKIHIDDNVADRLTKAFDVSRFNFLVVNIRLLNL
uniref:Uncharacterized protein n=1 Tax=Tanacetum cinerariifolium TaxID=118510 RepID=A0A6L2NE53_TANCI|nr:hypothetical protein [Tanacetum cinerariifolium]